MKGHIRQRSKGSWEIVVDIGKDPLTGKRRQHSETIKGGKKDAQVRLAELLIKIQKGGYIKQNQIPTLGSYLLGWLRNYADLHCSPRTVEGYELIVCRHLIPNLGQTNLNQLKPKQVSDYCYNSIYNGLSKRSVLHHFRLLHKALKDAVKLGLIDVNPCDAVEPPRPVDKEMIILRPSDINKFISVSRNAPWPYYYLFYTMLFTGLRRSEALALKWSNLNLDLCQLSVTQSLYKPIGKDFVMRPPKTRKSRRQIDLAPSLTLLLKEYKKQVEDNRFLLGKPLDDNDFVFSHPNGKPLDPSTATHAFVKIARIAELQGLRLHDLRHSYASLMLAAGVNVKAISQSMGHANIGITLDTYAHLLPGMGRKAAESFDKLLKPWLPRQQNVGKMSANQEDYEARLGGFEPTTLGSEDRCSIR